MAMSTDVRPEAVAETQAYHGGQMELMSPLDTMRHSAAHLMAAAVLEIFPDAKFAYGPPIENGFYYDFDLPRSLTPDDFQEIERRMAELVKADNRFVRDEITRERALELFADQPYKVETINDLPGEATISTYTVAYFTDLCRGPHVPGSGEVGPFKLMSVAAAYWKGDEKRPQLQRVYATAWPTQQELDDYLWRLEEAKKRDHRRIGKDLGLFSISEEVGPGLVLWHPKGARMRVVAEDFSRNAHLENGYEWVFSPHIGRAHLWETSGHLDFYAENMYSPMDIEGEEYYAKPMNCPFHIEIFKSGVTSYRDLPRRFAEFGTVYRYERSGVLHGMTRVRGFTQDDAHIFCRPDQVEAEIVGALEFSMYVLRAFGLTQFSAYLSTRPEKYVGEVADWERATEALRKALEMQAVSYELDEGGGAFYGPKIDLKVHDALGREWQLSTIQFDFNLPERFDIEYVDADGSRKRPYMVHRALLGSIERFFGILIEHYAGAFPVWLSPVQAVVIPIADRHAEYAEEVAARLRRDGVRVDVDARSERMQHKIREAQLQKVPYMLVVGDREREARAAAVRLRSGEDLKARPFDEIAGMIAEDIREYR
jgi:threonyl-tRNA synthetase